VAARFITPVATAGWRARQRATADSVMGRIEDSAALTMNGHDFFFGCLTA
jgi:hypothetical protein